MRSLAYSLVTNFNIFFNKCNVDLIVGVCIRAGVLPHGIRICHVFGTVLVLEHAFENSD